MPARASSCRRRPPTCTADTIGGTCRIAPVNVIAAARTSSIDTPLMSWVAVTLPAASSVDVSTPSTTSPVYVFGRSVRNRSKRVTRPTPTSNTPVASGSSVPEWPTFLVCNTPRNFATTSCDVQPAALSTTTRPSGIPAEMQLTQHVLHARRAPFDLVGSELERRRSLQPRLARHRRLQPDAMFVEGGQHALVAFMSFRRVEEHERVAQVRFDM